MLIRVQLAARHNSTRHLLCYLLIVLATLFAACDATTPVRQTTPSRVTPVSALPQVTITAKDYSFDMPETLQAGLVDVKLNNAGSQAHQAQLARLKDGVTYDQLLAALKRGPQAALPMVTLVGGPDIISPGQSQEVALKLSPGSYIALSFVTGQDNIIDVQKGMFKLFTVSQPTPAATGQATTGEPTADIQITLKDSTFTMPASIKAAMLTVKVTNQGTQPHALALMKLQPGRSLRDVQHFLQYPSTTADTPPFDYSGGMAALEPGASAWLILNLAPGNYVAAHDLPALQPGETWPQTNQLMAFSVQTA
ncbi:MAG: hypothetical protein IMW89_20475 [Ktedonobacteraceae bacterium]|nr:hypothetical protein [Ktedonobacteraceae bacterium]